MSTSETIGTTTFNFLRDVGGDDLGATAVSLGMATVSLRVGDHVSVETRVWGDGWAKNVHGEKEWKSGRTYGTVLRKEGAKWVCNFAEKDGEHVAWARSALRFERRQEVAPPGSSGGQSKATGKTGKPLLAKLLQGKCRKQRLLPGTPTMIQSRSWSRYPRTIAARLKGPGRSCK